MPFAAFFFTLICLLSNAQAEPENPEKREEKQQLQEILRKLEHSSEEREQQRLRVEKLNQQLKCNLELINAYKDCDARYKNSPKKHLECIEEAKKLFEHCSDLPVK